MIGPSISSVRAVIDPLSSWTTHIYIVSKIALQRKLIDLHPSTETFHL